MIQLFHQESSRIWILVILARTPTAIFWMIVRRMINGFTIVVRILIFIFIFFKILEGSNIYTEILVMDNDVGFLLSIRYAARGECSF